MTKLQLLDLICDDAKADLAKVRRDLLFVGELIVEDVARSYLAFREKCGDVDLETGTVSFQLLYTKPTTKVTRVIKITLEDLGE